MIKLININLSAGISCYALDLSKPKAASALGLPSRSVENAADRGPKIQSGSGHEHVGFCSVLRRLVDLFHHRHRLKQQLGLDDTELACSSAPSILTGSLIRLALGVWTDRYGGRLVFMLVMLAGAAATFLLSYATTFPMVLLAALGVGIAGGSFAVGIAYVSRWYPQERQGTALGIFGMGNVGSAVTKLIAPLVTGRVRLADCRPALGRRAGVGRRGLLVHHHRRSGAARAPRRGGQRPDPARPKRLRGRCPRLAILRSTISSSSAASSHSRCGCHGSSSAPTA